MKVLVSFGGSSRGILDFYKSKFKDGSIEFEREDYIENLNNFLSKGGTADRIVLTQDSLTRDGSYDGAKMYESIMVLLSVTSNVLSKTEVVVFVSNKELADILSSEAFSYGDRFKILMFGAETKPEANVLIEAARDSVRNFDKSIVISKYVYKQDVQDYSNQSAASDNNIQTEDMFVTADEDGDEDDVSDLDWEYNLSDEDDSDVYENDDEEDGDNFLSIEDIKEEPNEVEDVASIEESTIINEVEEQEVLKELDIDVNKNDVVDDTSITDDSNIDTASIDISSTEELIEDTDELFEDTNLDIGLEDNTNELFEDTTVEDDNLEDTSVDVNNLFDNSTTDDNSEDLFNDTVADSNLEKVSLDTDIKLDTKTDKKDNNSNKKEKKSLFGFGKKDKNSNSNTNLKDKDYDELYNVLDSYNRRGHLILVSGASNAGKTTVAGNMASLLANLGYSVALVDFDLAKRGQTYLSNDAYLAVRNDDNYSKVLTKAINNKTSNISARGAIVRVGLHLFGTSISEDTPVIDDVVDDKLNVREFVYNLKTVYNFIVVDCPICYLGDKLSEIVLGADSIILNVEPTNKSLSEFVLELSNIDEYKVRKDMFTRSKVLVNRSQSNSGVALGYKYKNYYDMLAILDRHIFDSTGYETNGMFSSIKVLGDIQDIKGIDNLILSDKYFSDTKDGKGIYLDLLYSLFVG